MGNGTTAPHPSLSLSEDSHNGPALVADLPLLPTPYAAPTAAYDHTLQRAVGTCTARHDRTGFSVGRHDMLRPPRGDETTTRPPRREHNKQTHRVASPNTDAHPQVARTRKA